MQKAGFPAQPVYLQDVVRRQPGNKATVRIRDRLSYIYNTCSLQVMRIGHACHASFMLNCRSDFIQPHRIPLMVNFCDVEALQARYNLTPRIVWSLQDIWFIAGQT